MNIFEKIDDFNKRWNIKDNSSHEEEFDKFKIRIFNEFKSIDNFFNYEEIRAFCQILGIKEDWKQEYHSINPKKYSLNVISALRNAENEKNFYFTLEIIFYFLKGNQHFQSFFKKLKLAIDLSNINLSVLEKDQDVVLFPSGEKTLDIKLVDEVFSFLNPECQKHFIDALKSYEKGTPADSIKSAESVRRSLEEFLRFKLKNQKGLDANITQIQTQLKNDSRDPAVRNMIFQVFSYLDKYFNENSKHMDGDIDEAENEFLIYQAGVLMRYIHKSIP